MLKFTLEFLTYSKNGFGGIEMEYCKYCGKKLDKNGRCSCKDFLKENPEKESVDTEVIFDGKKPIKADALTKDKLKKYGILAAVAAVILLIFILAAAIYFSANAYKTPIKDVIKGVNKVDTELILESVYTEDALAEKRVTVKNSELTWKDYLKQNDKKIDSKLDEAGFKRAKYDIVAKEKLSGSNLEEIEKFYADEYGADVKKAYRVEVEFVFKTKGGEETPNCWLTVVKLKNEGWKFCPKFSENAYYITESVSVE